MLMIVVKKVMTNSITDTVQELYNFYNTLKSHNKSVHFHQYFHHILKLILSTNFFLHLKLL